MKTLRYCFFLTCFLLVTSPTAGFGQATEFTYHGLLNSGGRPATGIFDLTFALYSSRSDTNQISSTFTNTLINVTDGLFIATLNFGSTAFSGPERWLEIGVRTNGATAFTQLSPRQLITAAPYAIMANSASNVMGTLSANQLSGTLPSSVLEGSFTGALSFNNLSNSYSGNGSGLTRLDPANISAGTASINIFGTAATAVTAATSGSAAVAGNFTGLLSGDVIGSQIATSVQRLRGIVVSTNAPLSNQHLRFDGFTWLPASVALETDVAGILPDARLSPNVVLLGGTQSFTGRIAFGATSGPPFSVESSGKVDNLNVDQLDGLHSGAFWKLGGNTVIDPSSDFIGTTDAQALEFRVNNVRALRLEPTTNSPNVIGGWEGNTVKDRTPFGFEISPNGVTIAGGGAIEGSFQRFGIFLRPYPLTVPNGSNTASASFGTISGGLGNDIGWQGDLSTIGGGAGNRVGAEHYPIAPIGATIGGGIYNQIHSSNYDPTGFSQTIAGGESNRIAASAFASIVGGKGNIIGDGCEGSAIGGGIDNLIRSYSAGHLATIGGGSGNLVSASPMATIGGGSGNYIELARCATIPGGGGNRVASGADCSFAAGCGSVASHPGVFVWSDGTMLFSSAAPKEFAARATGGVRFVTGIDTNGAATAGVQVAAGGTGWSAISDRNVKENFESVDTKEILKRVAGIPIRRWNMKTQARSIRHIGPMAQDFQAAFEVGEDNRHINSVDADGVALAAIQGLNELVKEKDAKIRELESRLGEVEKALRTLIKE